MMIQAVLGNPHHPEYGVATIPFPIPHDQYAHCMDLLEALEIGDAVKADCKVEEVDSFYTVLKRVEMLTVNEQMQCLRSWHLCRSHSQLGVNVWTAQRLKRVLAVFQHRRELVEGITQIFLREAHPAFLMPGLGKIHTAFEVGNVDLRSLAECLHKQ